MDYTAASSYCNIFRIEYLVDNEPYISVVNRNGNNVEGYFYRCGNEYCYFPESDMKYSLPELIELVHITAALNGLVGPKYLVDTWGNVPPVPVPVPQQPFVGGNDANVFVNF